MRESCTLCDKPRFGHGYCSKHYNRWRRHGDPEYVGRAAPEMSLAQKIKHFGWSEVERVPELGACWEWRGRFDSNGYGILKHQGRVFRVHRVAYELKTGEMLTHELRGLHHCDNPSCMRPAHIFVGTQQDNIADMVSKGRQRAGRKWTTENIKEAKALFRSGGVSKKDIERKYGMASGTMTRVMKKQIWKEID